MKRTALALAFAFAATQANARQITGRAEVIDSTVIKIGGQYVMLYGVDSVMRKQSCTLSGKPWACWPAAVRELQILVDQGPTTCETVGEPDDYGRVLGRCTVSGHSLNEAFVRSGFGLARPKESKEYVAAEADAKGNKRGLWQGQFVPPSQFRVMAGMIVDRP
jgi:endonuclease YncB( thermonuclease family)